MSLKELLELLRTEGQVIKNAPIAFASCVLLLVALAALSIFWFEERHYAGILAEKDATIQFLQTGQPQNPEKNNSDSKAYPNFNISIMGTHIIPTTESSISLLVLTVRIINYGQPSILKDWALTIRFPDGTELTSQPS